MKGPKPTETSKMGTPVGFYEGKIEKPKAHQDNRMVQCGVKELDKEFNFEKSSYSHIFH